MAIVEAYARIELSSSSPATASHPDLAAGLRFLSAVQAKYRIVVFAISSVILAKSAKTFTAALRL